MTVARSLTATFAGIAPGDAPAFVVVQSVAALAAAAGWRWLAAEAVAGSASVASKAAAPR